MSLCDKTIVVLEQDKRRFLERVDFNTCPGYFDGKPGRREAVGLRPNTGPCAVITDLAEYPFEDRELTLKYVHVGVGVTLEKAKAEVSWEIKISKGLKETELPTKEQLSVLRDYAQYKLPPT